MSQNRSHAVMSQRIEAHDSLDDFPTPPWGARALCEMIKGRGIALGQTCHEPAANRGYLARGLSDYFWVVTAADIHDYGAGYAVEDFLFPGFERPHSDWVITNPPFRLAEQFVLEAIARSQIGAAMLCRTQFSESVGRYNNLFRDMRPSFVWQFVERLPMVKGRVDPDASTATAYAWYVWLRERDGIDCIYDWIAPCRKRLERASDYTDHKCAA
jgi:hypothetical protein